MEQSIGSEYQTANDPKYISTNWRTSTLEMPLQSAAYLATIDRNFDELLN